VLFGAGQIAASQWGMQVQPFLIAAVLTGAVIFGFGWFMPARTVAGAQARRRVLGFEDFLSRVEGDRMERIEQTPQTFEKYLPFAMALGVEKAWANAFAAICNTPPTWYHGPPGSTFDSMTFGHRMNLMSSSVGSAMTSMPRSSSSSSGFSSGGGFSGGGFGGGGGGGF